MKVRSKTECQWDLVSLGEVMLRFDPGDVRVSTARHFRVWEGGGEYNVARGLRKTFGMKTAVVTALADNSVGRLVEDLMLQGGVGLDEFLSFDDEVALDVRRSGGRRNHALDSQDERCAGCADAIIHRNEI